MSITTPPHAPTRLARVRHRLSRCPRSRRLASPAVSTRGEIDLGHDQAAQVQTPAGPEAARARAGLARPAGELAVPRSTELNVPDRLRSGTSRGAGRQGSPRSPARNAAEALELTTSHRDRAVGPHHPEPRDVFRRRREDVPDQARRIGLDVAVGLDGAFGDRPHTARIRAARSSGLDLRVGIASS